MRPSCASGCSPFRVRAIANQKRLHGLDKGFSMKNALLASVATLATVSACSAFAADLPSRKAPAYVPPTPMWTGFYAGLNAGYNFGTNQNVDGQNVAPPWTFVDDNTAISAGNAAFALSGRAWKWCTSTRTTSTCA